MFLNSKVILISQTKVNRFRVCFLLFLSVGRKMRSCLQEFIPRRDCALEANPSLPFATAPELFPDPGRGFIGSRVGSYSEFKNKLKMETKSPAAGSKLFKL